MKDRLLLYESAAKELQAAELAKIKFQIERAKKEAAGLACIIIIGLMVISALLY